MHFPHGSKHVVQRQCFFRTRGCWISPLWLRSQILNEFRGSSPQGQSSLKMEYIYSNFALCSLDSPISASNPHLIDGVADCIQERESLSTDVCQSLERLYVFLICEISKPLLARISDFSNGFYLVISTLHATFD